MATRMEYAQQPVARCLERMERTVEEVAAPSATRVMSSFLAVLRH